MKTRAAVLTEIGAAGPYAETRPLRIEELDIDAPGAGELLVRIEAAGVCHSDLSVVDGNRPRPVPMALGHEAGGVVEEVGPGVRDVSVGDHVVLTFVPSCGTCAQCTSGQPAMCPVAAEANGMGQMLGGGHRLHQGGGDVHHHLGVSAFSERAIVARGSAVVVPSDIPLDTVALFGCAVLTGVGAVIRTAGVQPGQSVAVLGLGGVGLSAVMGAAVSGAHPIVAVDPVPSKREMALGLGASHAIDSEGGVETIRDLTDGGADFVFEAAGRAPVLETAYRATGRGGTTVAIGLAHPEAMFSVPAVSIVGEGKTIKGSYMGSAAPQQDIPRLLRLWRAGRLPVERLHTGTLPLRQINEAFDRLATGEVVRQLIRPADKS